ncbi:MAG TPA: hypothetical protein DCX53_14575 [Anaerolineae bacterium]|nr:hypothetical protein [Anaerolineae bacterium]
MKRKFFTFPSAAVLTSILLSACIGLIPLDDEPITGEYGPQVSLQEHQTQTFEALWKAIQNDYIYYETTDFEWDDLRSDYQKQIDEGLSSIEFDDLMRSLETDLPADSFIYQTRSERIETDMGDNSTYEGIGAFVGFDPEPNPHIVLLSVISGSPAERAGLKAHDSILAIDGKPIFLEEGIRAVERVRGPSGSTVTLTVRSPGKAERDIKVQRGKLVSSAQLEAYQITGTKFGYLLFPPIAYEGLLEDVVTSMQAFTTNQKIEGLILDLRIASSSSGWPLEGLFTMFYNGAIGEFYNRNNKQLLQVKGQDVFSSQSVPLIILVGRNTQGYSEILAGSLQMHKRAVIIGDNTNGTIETSSPFFLPNGARIYIETTSFVLPNGEKIGYNGIKPDVKIEAGWDEVIPNQDPVIETAIQLLEAE